MPGEFILNLLSSAPGTLVYHILVIIALLPAAGIIWSDWRRNQTEELRIPVITLATLMGTRLLAGLIAPFHVDSTAMLSILTAPYLYGVELLSALLLVWCFGLEHHHERASWLVFIVTGWLLLLGLATLIWYLDAVRLPITYDIYWRSLWYLLSTITALAGLVLTVQHPRRVGRRTVRVSFSLLAVGFGLGLIGMDGPARLMLMFAYPWFGVLIYQGAAHDLQTYREELKAFSQEALRQSQELLFLIEATRNIGESLDLHGMLGEVATNVAMALRADRVAILVLPPDAPQILQLLAFYDPLQSEVFADRVLSLKEYPILGLALQQGPVVYRLNEDYTPLLPLFKLLGIRNPGPVLLQPLTRRDRTMGLLMACNDASHGAFTPEQERLATTIGVQIAGALENSRLYQDVEKKATQLAELLRAREEELQRQKAIWESMAEGLLACDAHGRIILVNAAAESILNTERAALVGQNLLGLLKAAKPAEKVHTGLLMSLDQEREIISEFGERKVRIHLAPVMRADGERLGLVAVLEDITLELQAEQAKREFIASISHELRTPLTAIMGYVELLLSGMTGMLPSGTTQFIQVIRENAIRMNSITENLIAISEIESGKLGLVYEEVVLKNVLDLVLGRYRRRIEERHLNLNVDLPDDKFSFEADAYRLRIILDNLISNAVKFTYPGGSVTITAQKIEGALGQLDSVSLTVSDTGVGIRPEDQPYIWERFYRASNPLSLEAGGLGIGLTIVRALVEAHGGRVWVDSNPGQGSTFTVVLPVQQKVTLA